MEYTIISSKGFRLYTQSTYEKARQLIIDLKLKDVKIIKKYQT